MNEKDLHLRSEEVRQVMSHMPHWLLRWGLTGMFITVAILLALSFVVQYPDMIRGRITLTTETLPVSISAREDGKITHLFASENQWVKQGEHLAMIENAANYTHIMELREWFIPFHYMLMSRDSVTQASFNRDIVLGTVQPAYSQFAKSYEEYRFLTTQQFNRAKVAQLEAQVQSYTELKEKLLNQQELLKSSFEITTQKYQSDRALLGAKAISRAEFDLSEKQYLREKYELKNIDIEIINKNILVQNLQNEILKINQGWQENRAAMLQNLRQASLNLEAQLSAWAAAYLLTSPIEGKVSFFKYWTQNQFVKSGTELMLITPQTRKVFGYVYLSSAGFGKIKVGQTARIRLDGFPYEEFGSVKGVVAAKSDAAREGNYLVKIDLPDGLQTNYEKELHFTQDMQGEVYIITEDLRLIERFFYRFRHLVN